MINISLSSLAFAGRDPNSVFSVASSIGAQGIEWSNLEFLMPGDEKAASSLMMDTLKAGFTTVSYACSYNILQADKDLFKAVIKSAKALNAPLVRLLSDEQNFSDYKAPDYINSARLLGDEAAAQGLTLCLSLKNGSMLSNYNTAAVIMAELDHPFVKIAWEPEQDSNFDHCMEDFSLLSGSVAVMLVKHSILESSVEKRYEEWLHFLDAYDRQGGNPDMSRPLILYSIPENLSGIKESIEVLKELNKVLRRYHGLRVY